MTFKQQVFDPAHREVVLGDGHRDALDVGFLGDDLL